MAERPKSYGRSRSGVELTEETLERLAVEAEAGLDVNKLPWSTRPAAHGSISRRLIPRQARPGAPQRT